MSSSEEYLDSLLKSLTEGENHTSVDSSIDVSEADAAYGMQENVVSDDSAPGESNKAMSMNDIEAIFASMGEATAEESPEEVMDDFVLDESLMPEELALEEEELTLEGEELLEESPEEVMDDFVLDESLMPEELAMEEEEISEESPEEALDDFVLDESLMPEELAMEEEEISEEFPEEDVSDDLGLDDLGLDDLGLEDINQIEDDIVNEEESLDHFALEESGEDDEELSALLAGMGSDEDLAEINDLLEKADQGMSSDEDMLAMLGDVSGSDEDGGEFSLFTGEEAIEGEPENIREITQEELEERENAKLSKKEKKKLEKERKKKEKQARKNRKKNGVQEENTGEAEDAELNDLLESMDVTGEKPKKQGFFGKILNALLEEDEEDELAAGEGEAGSEIGNLSDENKELLAELKAEDKKNAKKKEKKGKKGKKTDAEAGAKGEGEEGEGKKKKPKKEKKKKQKNPEDEIKVPEKKLSKKKVTSIFLFCATIAACIIVLSSLLPNQIQKQEARVAYDYGQYEQVYDLLYGKQLNEEDEALFQKSSIILQTKRKFESYENYRKLDMPLEALNALIEGVGRYHNLRDEAELYRVSDELYDVYEQILTALEDSYGVSESEALDILSSGDDITYSQRLQSIIYGDMFGSDEEELPEVKQDVLPEEEEIIDRLQGTESMEIDDEALQMEENDEVMQTEEEFLSE